MRIRKHSSAFLTRAHRHNRTMFIRATCFSGFALIALVAGIAFFVIFFKNAHGTSRFQTLNIILALCKFICGSYGLYTYWHPTLVPLAGIVIFGTHGDLLRALSCCRTRYLEDSTIGTRTSDPTASGFSQLTTPGSPKYASPRPSLHRKYPSTDSRQSRTRPPGLSLSHPSRPPRIEMLRMINVKSSTDTLESSGAVSPRALESYDRVWYSRRVKDIINEDIRNTCNHHQHHPYFQHSHHPNSSPIWNRGNPDGIMVIGKGWDPHEDITEEEMMEEKNDV
ncbi:hypothetical protein GYMLUDRAFT_379888 [Collybiopsis luxurians FD-317 M1]|nr:hypothetical protein GYMLUDRAFT_379888 [Collybiopsis luxurians FD-317 M1]